MTNTTATPALSLLADEEVYDPIEDRLRANIRATIEAVFEEELEGILGRCRYGRSGSGPEGLPQWAPRAREYWNIWCREGQRAVRASQTRRWADHGMALAGVTPLSAADEEGRSADFGGLCVGHQHPSGEARALWSIQGRCEQRCGEPGLAKVKTDWEAWCTRSLADEDIGRLILDGTVVKTRVDRKATNISVLAAIGVRRDGQKGLLSIGNMGGGSTAAWRQCLNDLDLRGLKRPEFVIVDGAPGLEAALSELWGDDLEIQRCTVHKHRNLLAHAPGHMHDELTEDYRDMIYADTAAEVHKRRKAFLRKWRLKRHAVADSLQEARDKLFTLTRLPQNQWKSARTTNAIERLNEAFKRRIKTQTVLPSPETVPMLFWALMASGQIQMRKVDGWKTLDQPLNEILDLAA